MKFACGRNENLSAVASHFGCSEATVINASKAFGLTYDEVRNRRSLRRVVEMERRMPRKPVLSPRDRRILELYQSAAAPTLEQIAAEFDLTRQRVFQILAGLKERGIPVAKRSAPPMGHWVERCDLCHRLQAVARRTPLITARRLSETLGVEPWTLHWHVKKLRSRNLIPKHFGRLRSERLVRAIELFNREPSITAAELGRHLGYKNLPAAFLDLRRRGYGHLLAHSIERRRLTRRPQVVPLYPRTPSRLKPAPGRLVADTHNTGTRVSRHR
ncbi:MAG: hypothetical protein HY650_12865 [Acidobacteria bacterium]|nr:hypothetical protein [Acidobacteriota bacterium]